MNRNEDEIRGRIDQGIGAAKEHIGRATGDVDLEIEGGNQHDAGDIEHGIGKARRKVGEAISDLGKKLGR